MIKNYIFDFGNVLGQFYPEKLTAPYVDDKETLELFCEVVFDRLYWDKLDDGSITDDEVRAGIRSRVPENLGDLACKVYDNWIGTMIPVENMKELIGDIKKTDKKIYLLSNISEGFADTYNEVEWLSELLGKFDGLVFSGPIKMKKPNKEIFEYLLEKFDLKPEECLFIDDVQKNLDGAAESGISGYLFDGDAEKLRQHLGVVRWRP